MRLRPLIALPLLLPALAQCGGSILPPYQTVPATLTKAQQQSITAGGAVPTQIGICYDALTTNADQVRSLAAQGCGPDTVPRPIDRDFSLTNCPIFQPARATFACMAKTP